MSFTKLTDTICEKNVTENGLDLSIFIVIEPIYYHMKLWKIVFLNFTFMFLSTSARLRDDIAVICDSHLEPKTGTDAIFDEAVDLKEGFESVISQRVTTNSPFLIMLLEVYLELALMTSCLTRKKIRSRGFDKYDGMHSTYWYYVGTQELTPNDVVEKYDKKIEWLGTHRNGRSFVPFITAGDWGI